MKALTTLLVVGMFLMPAAMADDVDDVKAAVLDFYEQLNNENPNFTEYFLPGGSSFPRTGSLLQPSNSDRNATQANFDAGLDFDVAVRHLDAKVYGDTAVATYYTTGPTKYEDGSTLQGIFRASMSWAKQGGQWRIVHIHISPLQSQPEQ